MHIESDEESDGGWGFNPIQLKMNAEMDAQANHVHISDHPRSEVYLSQALRDHLDLGSSSKKKSKE